MAFLIALILFGGIKRIGAVCEKLIPFMSALYILFTLIVIFAHIGNIGHAFGLIFQNAFSTRALAGGAAGIAIKETIVWVYAPQRVLQRGRPRLRRHRARGRRDEGPGSSRVSTASSSLHRHDRYLLSDRAVRHLLRRGHRLGRQAGQRARHQRHGDVFGGKIAALFIAIALAMFAFSTILGWSLYGTRCVQYLFGLKGAKVYQFIFVVVVVLGSIASLDTVWDIADTLNGLMAIPELRRGVCALRRRRQADEGVLLSREEGRAPL
jgi:AGCS family alanine or glycine:cation symporter